MTADQCRQQFPNDRVAQLTCARKAFAAAAPETQPIQRTQQPPPLASPLANTQIIFGFFDRRFPGFNNGLEHLGVDFSAAAGATVAAICDGTVVSNNTGQADTVSAVLMVEQECPQPLGRVFAYYGHVQSELLPGMSVAAGSGIGSVREWPGNSHLHLGLSTRLQEETWGVVARGTSLQELEAQGWLNPLDFLAATQPRQAASSVVRPAVARPPPPRAGRPTATSKVKPKRKP
jgi:murein DD-endopeptidase MepM/ murein hydrolase activator NlpD